MEIDSVLRISPSEIKLDEEVLVAEEASGNEEHFADVEIPSVRNEEFNKWFDNIQSDEFNKI